MKFTPSLQSRYCFVLLHKVFFFPLPCCRLELCSQNRPGNCARVISKALPSCRTLDMQILLPGPFQTRTVELCKNTIWHQTSIPPNHTNTHKSIILKGANKQSNGGPPHNYKVADIFRIEVTPPGHSFSTRRSQPMFCHNKNNITSTLTNYFRQGKCRKK